MDLWRQMMPKPGDEERVDHLRPYRFHGVGLGDPVNGQVTGDCPWCGREGKFGVAVDTGQWRCVVCAEGTDKGGGNVYTFIRKLWEEADRTTTLKDLDVLAADRGVLNSDSLAAWGVARSPLTGDWLVPAYGADGKLDQLYKYSRERVSGKMILYPTPTIPARVFGASPSLYDASKPEVYVCEGPWDAVALWEALRSAKRSGEGEGLRLTASDQASLYGSASVVAVPGCSTFHESWLPLLAGKRVTIMFDNDHPRADRGRETEPAAWVGARRLTTMASGAESVRYLAWGGPGRTHDPDLPNGYDVRDALSGGTTAAERVKLLEGLLLKVADVPADWEAGRKSAGVTGRVPVALRADSPECLPCSDWRTLQSKWRVAMKWIPGLNRCLVAGLASMVSTETPGEQLWFKMVSPPSSGKTTVCEALSVNRTYAFPKDTMTGLFSGYQVDVEGKENLSMAAQIHNKTLVIKDADTVLQNPALPQILSQFRALYDRSVRTSFKNKMSRDWENLNSTVILFGTNSVEQLDSSELGERFLDSVIVDGIDDDLEDEINWRVANRTVRNMRRGSQAADTSSPAGQSEDPDILEAKRMTGGYVGWLKRNADDALAEMAFDEEAMRACTRFGKFVAFMRARPSTRKVEKEEREFSGRLVSQILRLGMCSAFVLGRKAVDDEPLTVCRDVALDTARGRTLDIARILDAEHETGVEAAGLARITNQEPTSEAGLLYFLRKIKAAETFTVSIGPGVRGKPRWRLTERFRTLYREVVGA